MTTRYLAQKITDRGGREYPLAVLVLPGDGSYSIEPFSGETAATIYVNGMLLIDSQTAIDCTKKRKLCEKPEVWLCELAKKP